MAYRLDKWLDSNCWLQVPTRRMAEQFSLYISPLESTEKNNGIYKADFKI
jgi:hypothetical protein